ncbi:MAG: glycosyltransferase [Candidatus Caldarchaeum sp.]
MSSVSVVILTRNSELTIGQCLEAVAALSSLVENVVVVDGCSTDSTLEIVKNFRERLHIVILSDQGHGLGYARDIGWRSVSSPYVIMLDSDVIIRPDFPTEAMKVLQLDSRVGGVAAKLRPVILEKGWLAAFQAKNLGVHLHLREPVYPYEAPALHTACTMYRRSALEAVDGFDHSFFFAKEDSDISFKLRKAGYKLYYLGVEAQHLERARLCKMNFRYGRSYVQIYKKHPDMAPLLTPKNILLAAALLFPLLQVIVYLNYLLKYWGLPNLKNVEKVVLSFIEVVRQLLRTAGMLYELLRKLVGPR